MSEAAKLAEAIARIELITKATLKLQAEIERLMLTHATYRDVARASTLESIQTISRYRAALDAITRLPVGRCYICDDYEALPDPCARCGEARDIARAALEA